MGRFRRKRRRSYQYRRMTKQEKFQWVFASVVFVLAFIVYFTFNFVSNCIWEWPPRWDIGTCWNEQIEPSQEKAIEKAAPFAPSRF